MSSGPLSVPIPPSLRRRLAEHARKHHLKVATAARALIDERLTELEQALSPPDEWQREAVWATLAEVDEKGPQYVSRESVHKVIRAAVTRVARRK